MTDTGAEILRHHWRGHRGSYIDHELGRSFKDMMTGLIIDSFISLLCIL